MNHLLQKVTFRLSHFVKSKILQAGAIRCLQPRLALSHDAMNWLSHLPMAGEDHVGKNTKTKTSVSHVFLMENLSEIVNNY